jgi:hypothetical protein
MTVIDLAHQPFRALEYVAVPPTPKGIAIRAAAR